MNKEMTRNAFLLILFLSFGMFTVDFATADSPVVQGLGGAGRAGVPREGLFSNPAAVGLLTESGAFLIYEKPRIPDWNAGGRLYSVGAFDGQNAGLKGAFGYIRTSRARVENTVSQSYEDRSEYRMALGLPLAANVAAGLRVQYITRRTGSQETKIFNGGVGTIFPVYSGLIAGLTYENLLNKPGELAPTMGAGLSYALGYGIQVYGDGYRQMKGPKKGERGWALGAETALAGELRVRGGRFQDGDRRRKGWSMGASWVGPRTSFDYAMRTSGDLPKERDHILGLTTIF